MKKEDYKVPSLIVVQIKSINLLSASKDIDELTNNGDDTTSGETNEEEEFNGLFD
jgi:hypothetical protein